MSIQIDEDKNNADDEENNEENPEKNISEEEKSVISHIFGGIHSNVYGNEKYLTKEKVLTTLKYILK